MEENEYLDGLRLNRIKLRAHKRRLGLDIARYGVLFQTPLIERQLNDWRRDFAQTERALRETEREIANLSQ